jgi:aryl-alcohol dehydrogenase-like predicted oxidoreductase
MRQANRHGERNADGDTGASQLKVTRSRMAPGSSAGTGGRWTSRLPVEAVQPPYDLFRRGIEAGLLPYAAAHHIGVLACGPLARGLPGGTITEATTFGPGDWRSHSPAFTGPGFGRNLEVVAALSGSAADRGAPSPSSRWPGCWPTRPSRPPSSARTPHHLQERVGALDLAPSRDDLAEIDSIMAAAVPLGGPSPEGMT